MALKQLNPTTPGQRHRLAPVFDDITQVKPERTLVFGYKGSGGRNNTGKRTMRYIGGGHKKLLRLIDFYRDKHGIPGIVKSIEYDPNRTARIALVHYSDGEKKYILAPKGLKVNQKILSGKGVPPDIGNSLPLNEIPMGTLLHNVELHPGRGAAMARSAGTYVQLLAKEGNLATLRLPSGEMRMVSENCFATVGTVSNEDHMNEKIGKAGRNRWLGRRPRTRGVAMNPVDHPMGGGEGKASGGHPRSRKGLYAKGLKTRNRKKRSNQFILQRRKK
ncbi:MAG: 50S ribosomal protein L2 [Bacteroidetes bacterium RIFCSPLOWO2_02_FULL_36_8]|nr:MAG: 50S ribosomal protein L2 [Bacteroidetes bacterium RIFCSPLOWO2_02_FULL_36_8]OFY69399.1 MAG: 50S ribosomal protein L2 [Bacteroidetes bacterium RIFCSPLOWO2_12_FULL_37_12]